MESLTIVAGNPGLALARFDARSRSNDENNENMDLVLRAVNAHDELVEALTKAMPILAGCRDLAGCTAYELARAALAKAGA